MPRIRDESGGGLRIARPQGPHETAIARVVLPYNRRLRNDFQVVGSRLRLVCTKAMRVQLVLVRNAFGSIACVLLTNAFYSLGDIFSGKPSRLQSRDQLIVANSVWAAIAFCIVVFVAFFSFMLKLKFLNSPKHPTLYCLQRLAQATFVYFLGALAAVLVFGYLAVYLARAKPAVFKYKLDSYADNLSLLIYFTGILREVKKIFYKETCQGRERLQLKRKKSQALAVAVSPNDERSPPPPPHYHTPVFWKTYVKHLPTAIPSLLATMFVHTLSRQRIVERGTTALTIFYIGGLLVKIGIQELAKHYVIMKRIRSPRIMCVLVGVPTVLIDTQTRIILLGSSSTNTAAKGILGMAFVEISLRGSKVILLQWTISRRQKALPQERANATINPNLVRPSLSSKHLQFEIWRHQVQAFHTAEINADMYAEYIAIGCSASILMFFGTHPHYSLVRQSYTATAINSLSAWRLWQLSLLALQLGVELVVDYVAIVLEMLAGLEFEHIKHLGSFLAVLFMVAAVMNTTITLGVYLS